MTEQLRLELSAIIVNLSQARRSRGMPRNDVAAHLHVSLTTIREWENGHRVPTFAKFLRWVDLLDRRVVLVPTNGIPLKPRPKKRRDENRMDYEGRRLIHLLWQRRTDSKLSQENLAEKLELRRPSLSRLENRGTDPRLMTLVLWAALLDVRLTVEPKNGENP